MRIFKTKYFIKIILAYVTGMFLLLAFTSCAQTPQNPSETPTTTASEVKAATPSESPKKPELKIVNVYNGVITLPDPSEQGANEANDIMHYFITGNSIFFASKPYIDALINDTGGIVDEDNRQLYMRVLETSGDNVKILEYDTIEISDTPALYISYTRDLDSGPHYIQEASFIVNEHLYKFSLSSPNHGYSDDDLNVFKELFLKIMSTLQLDE